MAQSWGVEPTPGGKKVWFSLGHTPGAANQVADTTGGVSSTRTVDVSDSDLDVLLERLGVSDEDGPMSLHSGLVPAL